MAPVPDLAALSGSGERTTSTGARRMIYSAPLPSSALQQLTAVHGPRHETDPRIRDLTALPWCSIDNDDSLDLDQFTASEPLERGAGKMLVAVADVDALVKKGSTIDEHAHINTTSAYTTARGVSDAARAPVYRPDLAQPA